MLGTLYFVPLFIAVCAIIFVGSLSYDSPKVQKMIGKIPDDIPFVILIGALVWPVTIIVVILYFIMRFLSKRLANIIESYDVKKND